MLLQLPGEHRVRGRAVAELGGGAAGRADVDDCVAVAERAVADGVADPSDCAPWAGATAVSSPRISWASDRICSDARCFATR